MKRSRPYILTALLVLWAGCAPLNPRLDSYDYKTGYRFGNCSAPGNPDDLFIVLAFSGGGTRAAAFSYGVLKELSETMVTIDGVERPLLDEVDVISSVSGGSFTAAYYGLHRDRIFEEFRDEVLRRNIQMGIAMRLIWPWNWFRLMSAHYSRIDMAAEYYADHIFGDATFAKLISDGRRPFIIINATDLSLGTRFEFTQRHFDLLQSDLAGVQVARAVAASSAFPGLLSPVTMKNYEKTNYKEPEWIDTAIECDLDISPRRFVKAQKYRSYFDVENRPYIHLVDGGVADNIGLRGPLHSLMFPDTLLSGDLEGIDDNPELNIQRMIANGKIRKLVMIVVDAKPGLDTELDESGAQPGLTDVIVRVASAPLENYSFETVQLMRDYFAQREKEQEGDPEAVKTYGIHIRFDSIKDAARRKRLEELGTNFDLDTEDVDALIEAGAELLRESDTFKNGLLADLRSGE